MGGTFQYLLPFFKDERYIKEGNKPLFVIYRPQYITELSARLAYYNKRAQEEGFDGLVFAAQHVSFMLRRASINRCLNTRLNISQALRFMI